MVRVAAPVDAVPQEIAGLYVLVDSSASRALGYATQVRRIGELIAGLRDGAGGSTPLGVAAFDQEVVPVFEGPACGFGEAELQRLAPAGRWAPPTSTGRSAGSATAWPATAGSIRGSCWSPTASPRPATPRRGRSRRRCTPWARRGVERLDVLAVGGLRDEAVLRELTTGNLAHDGQRIDGAAPLSEIARRLTLACRSGIPVKIDGRGLDLARDPRRRPARRRNPGLRRPAGGPAAAPHARRQAGRAGGEPASAERPLLERAWVQARIERLLHLREATLAGDDDLRRALGLQIVELSVKHRVLSPFTAMLVLESEFDYARFGLDRRALADVLTVGPGGLEVLARTRMPAQGGRSQRPRRGRSPWNPTPSVERGAGGAKTRWESRRGGGRSRRRSRGRSGRRSGGRRGRRRARRRSPGGSPSESPRRRRSRAGREPALAPDPRRRAPRARGWAARRRASSATGRGRRQAREEEKEPKAAPYTGRFAEVKEHLAAGRVERARALAEAWNAEAPGDVLALLALGEAWEAAGEKAAAARAYGSLIDLFPSRVDMRRLAGERLERLGERGARAGDRHLSQGRPRPAGPPHGPPAPRLGPAARRPLRGGLRGARKGPRAEVPAGPLRRRRPGAEGGPGPARGGLAPRRAGPARDVLDRLEAHGASIDREPSLRFVLSWETDANDVDLHV